MLWRIQPEELITSIGDVDARAVELRFSRRKHGEDKGIVRQSGQDQIETRSFDEELAKRKLMRLKFGVRKFPAT